MKNAGFQPVADFLKDIEEVLVEWDYWALFASLPQRMHWKTKRMRKINNRQYKLTHIKRKPPSPKTKMKVKKGRRYDSKLD